MGFVKGHTLVPTKNVCYLVCARDLPNPAVCARDLPNPAVCARDFLNPAFYEKAYYYYFCVFAFFG